MGIQAYLPNKEYQHFIKEYWNLIANRPMEIEGKPVPVLPDGSVEIIFNYGDSYNVTINNKTYTINQGVYLRGVCIDPIVLNFGRKIRIWGLRVNPIWVKKYLNHDLRSSYDRVVQLNDFVPLQKVTDKAAAGFWEVVVNTIDWTQKKAINEVVQQGIDLMETYKGNIKMEDLSKDCCLSVSAFERKFKKELGLTPKAYCQLIRFKHITNQILLAKEVEQIELIHEHDLTDHSHLSKITKSYSNETPTNLKSKIRRFFTKVYLVD